MENLEREKEQLSHAVETNAIIAKLLESHTQQNKWLWISNVVSWVIILGLILCMGYQSAHMQETVSQAIADSQAVFNEALTEAFNTIAEMEVVSDTTTIEGDNATYNDVAGDQFNDSAQKIGGVE